jgi:hypothetical protein
MLKINRWFLGLLLAVLWPSSFMLGAEELSPGDVSSSDVISSPSGVTVPSGIDSAVQMAQEEVRDPFATTQPLDEAPVAAAGPVAPVLAPEIDVKLQGIGFGSKDAYAVIGGEVFYQGDEKKGIKLLEVRRREVDILMNGGKVTVPLFPDEELQKAKDRAKKKNAVKVASVGQPSETPSSLSGREQPPL